MLEVWEKQETHEQQDYLDCLWAQLQNLQSEKWLEQHVGRFYVGFDSVLSESVGHNLPS